MSFIIISSLFLQGCSYRDLNKLLFVTAVFVDIDENNKPIMYLEVFKPIRSIAEESAKGRRVLFKGSGKTISEVANNVNLSSSYQLDYTQCKVIIFSEKAAEYGLEDFMDFFLRNQAFVIRNQLAIYRGDTESLMKVQLKEEEYLGVFIAELIRNKRAASRAIEINMQEFYNQRFIGDKVNTVPMISVAKVLEEDKIAIGGMALVERYKMIGMLEIEEGQAFNFLLNNIDTGTLEVRNPQDEDRFVTLRILKSRTKTQLNYVDDRLYVKKIINVKVTIEEVQRGMDINKNIIDQIERNAEANIREKTLELFAKYKEKEKDIFDIEEEFHRRYPDEKIENIMRRTRLNVEAHVYIEGSTNIQDAR